MRGHLDANRVFDFITMSALPIASRLWLFDDRRLGRKDPNVIIGADAQPSVQQIVFVDRKLENPENGD